MISDRLTSRAALVAVWLAAGPAAPIVADEPVVRLGERLDRVSEFGGIGYRATVDVAGIGSSRQIDLALPGGELLRATRSELERRGDENYLWSGETAQGEHVVLTSVGGRLAGTIFGLEHSYQISPEGDGGHALVEVDRRSLPDCGGAPIHGGGDAQVRSRAATERARAPLVDVLVAYSGGSVAAVGSARNMRTVVQHFVDLTNVAFHNSEVDARIRLVHSTEVTVPASVASSNSMILDWLPTSTEVAGLRSTYGADLVGLIHEAGTNICGSAAMIYRPGGPGAGHAFFESRRACGAETFAHELGHLMGADHDPDNARVASGQYIYGRGHFYDDGYRTVMTYARSCDGVCPSQPFFSSPGVSYDGRATGLRRKRDNARILSEFAGDIESFVGGVNSGTCPLSPGDPDYCLECGPCVAGEGNCVGNSECDSGLTCVPDSGADFGLAPGVGVCQAKDGCALDPGDPDYCRVCGPCGFGAGDCDSDRECQAGLICLDDIGDTFGLSPATDVCGFRANGFCPLDPGHPDYCAACGPCEAGEGNCKSNLECTAFLTCFPDVGGQLGFKAGTDVCLPSLPSDCAFAVGDERYCKLCGVCDVGEGDCDTDRECQSGLSCVDGAGPLFGFGEGIDLCLEAEGGDTGALKAPRKLKAKALSATRVRLRWKDKSKDEDGFFVEMSREGGSFERIGTTEPNKKKLFVEGLEPATTYTFRVQAFGAAGTSAFSNEKSVTTKP